MAASDALRRAIDLARAGQKIEARDLLLQVVDDDPRNEAAWTWLSGLVDSLEDKIIACENVLTINPANEKVRAYLLKLQQQQKEAREKREHEDANALLQYARTQAENGNTAEALRVAHQAAEKQAGFEDAWLLIARLSADLHQRISALETALEINPSNNRTKLRLDQARRLRDDPLGMAAYFEQAGKLDAALHAYKEAAAKAKDSREFDRVYKQILRIEALQEEKITYVAPQKSILRLAFGWPILYFSLMLIQVGLNPISHPAFVLWLGLPLVALGSFLLSVSEIRSRHFIWEQIFAEQGDGSHFARGVAAFAGWVLVILPHLLLLLDSINRLRTFRIPPEPF